MEYAHRLAYERAFGPIPTGMQIDHLCRVRECVNPDHLEVVSHTENVRRGIGVRLVAAGPAARTLDPNQNATDGAVCATRREVWVIGFRCGAGAVPEGDTPPARWLRPHLLPLRVF